MPIGMRYIPFLLLVLGLYACVDDPPASPDEVIRLYQAYVDQNRFEQAALLSTPAEAQRLQELAKMIAADADDSVLYTSFEQINCQAAGVDTIECACHLTDQYETYNALFTLVRLAGGWRVDLPQPEDVEYQTDIEAAYDSLRREWLNEN